MTPPYRRSSVYAHTPPTRSRASSTTGLRPSARQYLHAIRPDHPAPSTITSYWFRVSPTARSRLSWIGTALATPLNVADIVRALPFARFHRGRQPSPVAFVKQQVVRWSRRQVLAGVRFLYRTIAYTW